MKKEKEEEKIDKKQKEKEKLQEKGMQLILLEQELKKIEEQHKIIDQSILSMELTKSNLDEIKGKKNKEIFASIAEGMWIKAKAENTDKIFVNVGQGVVIEKNIDEAKKIIDEKIEELSILKSILAGEAEKVLNEIKKIEEEVKRITGK